MNRAAGLALFALGCRAAPAVEKTAAGVPESPAVPDTLVLAAPGGRSIWLAEGRIGRDSSGAECAERSVEIRTDSATIKIPLLFVRRAPTLLNQTHLRAELSRDCRVMAIYSVDLATGRPLKLEDR